MQIVRLVGRGYLLYLLHQRVITKHYRRLSINNSSSDGEVHVEVVFDEIHWHSNPRFTEPPSPFD